MAHVTFESVMSLTSDELRGRSPEWRRLERPATLLEVQPDELRLARARRALSDFVTLWRNPAVPDRLREEAIREVFERFDVDGPEIVAADPQPNEDAWLLRPMG